jgi:hypothetical protein
MGLESHIARIIRNVKENYLIEAQTEKLKGGLAPKYLKSECLVDGAGVKLVP